MLIETNFYSFLCYKQGRLQYMNYFSALEKTKTG